MSATVIPTRSTPTDPEAVVGPPVHELFCPVCGASRWADAVACDRFARTGWPECCGRPVRCHVFGNPDVPYADWPDYRTG